MTFPVITVVLIAINILVSLACFNNRELFYKLALNPYSVKHHNQWYRLFTHAFVHADYLHLIVNMYVLYLFGDTVENEYRFAFQEKGNFFFVLMYFGAILAATVSSLARYKDNATYNSVGASGATSAIIFATIAFHPVAMEMGLIILPIMIPAFIFGALFLIYESIMDKRGRTNIAHDAHFYGAVFGFLFTMAMEPALFFHFISEISNFLGGE